MKQFNNNQISIFDGTQPLKITKPIRLIELFAGIGAQAKALERIGVPFEHYRICEFDKYAVTSYNAIHGTHFETSDITKISADDLGIVDTDKYTYIMTCSYPCQDLSLAGKRLGMSRGGQTRSGLLWEVERLLRELTELPQILVMENVPQVIGQKNIADFAEWIAFLEQRGYTSKWEVLNAKDFNVPQNRERWFMVSWLGDYYYDFPKPTGCHRRLKDVLETDVDEKYYILEASGIKFDQSKTWTHKPIKEISPTIDTQGKNGARCILAGRVEGGVYGHNFDSFRRVYDTDGMAPTQRTCGGGNLETKIIEPQICGMRGRNPDNPSDRSKGCPTEQRIEVGGYVSNALTTVQKDNLVYQSDVRIRKLTPRECFRLMDFDDADFVKAKCKLINDDETAQWFLEQEKKVHARTMKREEWKKFCVYLRKRHERVSDSQCYKQAGNSIVVAVLEAIFRQLI